MPVITGSFRIADRPDAAELKLASVQFSSFGPLAFETCSHRKRKIPRELKSPSGFMDQLTEMNRKIRDRRSRPKAGARSCFPRHVSNQVMWRSERESEVIVHVQRQARYLEVLGHCPRALVGSTELARKAGMDWSPICCAAPAALDIVGAI